MDCIFCNIINKEMPADVLYEDDKFVAFKDVKPSAPVHILIVPKEHIASINDLDKKHCGMIGDMFLLAKKLAEEQGISDGYKLAFNTGRKGGQSVDHLHSHLKGGWK